MKELFESNPNKRQDFPLDLYQVTLYFSLDSDEVLLEVLLAI